MQTYIRAGVGAPSMPVWTAALGGVFAAALIGCAPSLGDRYTVKIDPAWTTDEQAQILDAVSNWEATVPVHLTAVIARPADDIVDHEIGIHRSTEAECYRKGADGTSYGITWQGKWDADGGCTWIAVDTVPPTLLEGTIAHELGHAMGLRHESAKTPLLMAAQAGPGWSPSVTPNDVDQWFDLRGRAVPGR